jgi:hypothetical protein
MKSLQVPNAGGNSQLSEAWSIHFFVTCRGATNVVFEKDVQYWIEYKMIDFLCTIHNHRVGVSVTRAMGYPHHSRFTFKDAMVLVEKKLSGLILARRGVCDHHLFNRSVLHVWCQTPRIARLVRQAYRILRPTVAVEGTLEVLTTVSNHQPLFGS